MGEGRISTEPWRGRTDEVLERSRFVLGALVFVTLVVCAPYLIAVAGDDRPAIVACVPILLVSIVASYRAKRVRLVTEVLEAACLCTVMAAIPTPLTAFIFLFPLLWCRALYGDGRQMLLRSALQMAGTLLSVPLSRVLFQPVEPNLSTFLTVGLSSIFFIGVAGRQLAVGMRAHDDGARRDRLISAGGLRLLGVTDRETIREISWQTMTEVCRDVPDLWVLLLQRGGERHQVLRTVGTFPNPPVEFAAADLGLQSSGPVMTFGEPQSIAVLDQVVARPAQWVMQSFSSAVEHDVVLVLGQAGRSGPDITSAVQTVANQAGLAFQNSQVHTQLTVQALTDGLTGLANRQGFTKATQRMIADAGDSPIAVLFVDLDNFKEVNDTLGHNAGDDLLQQVATLLTSVTRAHDIVARLGGDEFAILLQNTPQAIAEQVAERVVLGIAVLSLASGTDLGVGASIGVAMADHSTHLENLLVHADLAMYAAKSEGKGCVQTYHPGLLPAPDPIEP